MKNAQLSSHSKSKKKQSISNRPQKYNKREKLVSLSNINFYKNSNYSLNKENISSSYNSQVKQISTNSSSNSLQKNLNKKKENKESNLNRQSLIKKCQIKFTSLYNNYLSHSINNCNLKSNINNVNRIRVNKNANKVLSPINSSKSNYNKRINKNKSNKSKNKLVSKTNRNQYLNNKNNIMQYANYKDIYYIKYININVDIDKIKYIQCWWRYIYNIIFLQKNIRTFLAKIKTKQKLKYNNFIAIIIKIFFNSFIYNMQISYLRKVFFQWKEITYKRNILSKWLSKKEKKLFSLSNNSHNSLIIDKSSSNNRTMTFWNVKNMPNIPFNNSSIFQEKINFPFQRVPKETMPMNVKIKFNKLLNDRKRVKNSNIIIINNNINNNCQQLINNNIKQNKVTNFSNNYYKKTGNNNSMIDIQPTDTSLNCTAEIINNQSDKSSNSILIHNHINGNQKKKINDKKNISKTNKTYYLKKMIKKLINNRTKKILGKYLNKWKTRIVMKKCSLSKNSIIDEKIIYFQKSPNSNNNIKSHIMSNNYIDNQNNNMYIYSNNCNYTYDNNISAHNKSNSKIFFNNNDFIMQTMFTENNIKNTKNIYGNNPTLLRNRIFTPSNKYSFYTQYPNENMNNINYIKPPRETEPKIVYHKKKFPPFGSKNMKQNNNTIIIDYNYNRGNNLGHNNKMRMNMNGINYGNNIISNFYSSNNFFNRRNNYHLENMNNMLPEEKYGFKKNNKIEEREISFSPSLTRKNQTFKNVIKDNYQNINNNNIYINVVENYRSDFQNQNMNNLNDLSRLNYGSSFQSMNRSATEEDILSKLMCHSHSQGFTKTIQSLFGH